MLYITFNWLFAKQLLIIFTSTSKKGFRFGIIIFDTFLSVTLDRFADRVGVQPRKQKRVSVNSQPISKKHVRFEISKEYPTDYRLQTL